jgi:hypothetical protein
MAWGQHVGMNFATHFRAPPWLPVSAMLSALLLIVLNGFGLARSPRILSPAVPAFTPLARWHDAGRDWLLVADGKTDQLVVYNAADGRPLHRLALEHRLSNTHTLKQRDGDLMVMGEDGTSGELGLPQRQWAPSSGH